MKPDSQRWALFGGTFDPVHEGHLALVQTARERCGLDRIIFIPCARSPFKSTPTVASPEERHSMLCLSLEEKGWQDWAEVSRFEIDRPPPSFSWQTTAHFRCTEPGVGQFCWIVGADQWAQIDRWAEPEKLRDELHFIVVTRKGTQANPRAGWQATFLEFDHPASATEIRQGRGDSDWLPRSVRDFITAHQLYRDARADRQGS